MLTRVGSWTSSTVVGKGNAVGLGMGVEVGAGAVVTGLDDRLGGIVTTVGLAVGVAVGMSVATGAVAVGITAVEEGVDASTSALPNWQP